ncbi:MAG: alkaline phosphatase D family protein [Gammaproteobacteria bacterium]|nr:alkaline phosphatase D family protein [Gammaproteobacteria bacterium]
MTELILGPLLRYVGPCDATVWVETSAACDVEILDHRAPTFHVEGHHYAIVYLTGLEPGRNYQYAVLLDGEAVWPEPDSRFPPSTIYTPHPDQSLRLVFGSCRISLPQVPPFTLLREQDARGRGIDALRTLALRLRGEPPDQWPHALLFLGDQIYADEVSPETRQFIRGRRDTDLPPGEEIADFEEYTRLYRETWGEPTIRWLLSTLPSAMIFDDHDVNDDWNISAAWVAEKRAQPWWQSRIVGGFMSYWIYQHLGNLSPRELKDDEMFRQVRDARNDAGSLLREFAARADRYPSGCRWSFYRDFGRVRLVMMDSRAARVLDDPRAMIDADEWAWIAQHAHGDFDHVLLGASLPMLLAPAIHYLEAWSEAVCDGAWGKWPVGAAEKLRQAVDLEHWSAFDRSFTQLTELLHEIASGARGHAPATVILLSGDVHHAYLAKASFPRGEAIRSSIYQAVCSPLRNALGASERRAMRFGWSAPVASVGKALARAAGVPPPILEWQLMHAEPWFGNQIATLEMRGRRARLQIEKPVLDQAGEPILNQVFESALDGPL